MVYDNCGHINSQGHKFCEECWAGPGVGIVKRETRPRRRRCRSILIALLVAYPILLLAISLVNTIEPKRTGLLALSEVFAPYLFLPLLLLAPFALMRGTRLLRVMLLICMVVFCVRFLPRLVEAAPQSDPGAIHLSAMQWNVLAGGQYGRIMEVLRAKPASIVSLVEAD